MGIFNVDGRQDDKMKFLYTMMDHDRDGYVDQGDFECILMLVCGIELCDEEVPPLGGRERERTCRGIGMGSDSSPGIWCY